MKSLEDFSDIEYSAIWGLAEVVGDEDYMGRCILTLTRVILEGEYKDSLQLEGAKSGKLNLHLKWMPQSTFCDS
ncbi:hypothetical protein CRYUN_Cryun33cG0038300 [Craigia yunnanensis]